MSGPYSIGLTALKQRTLAINALDGVAPVCGGLSDDVAGWVLDNHIRSPAPNLELPPAIDLVNWKDPRVGWGVVMSERARIPAPISRLLKERQSRVFRYRHGTSQRLLCLRDADHGVNVDMTGSPRGMAIGSLPSYLLIVGSPADVPWEVQFILGCNRCVGRLDLEPEGLANYVEATLGGFAWPDAASVRDVLIWAVDTARDPDDITTLMRQAIAEPLYHLVAADPDRRPHVLDGCPTMPASKQATVAGLVGDLVRHRPGLIVTTSHGMTGPLDDLQAMRRNLGLPVDINDTLLRPEGLTDQWEPAGAVWYAHACCSAGAQSPSLFQSLFKQGSPLERVLNGIATAGSMVAPLPRHLLGRKRPLRAFVGHVEPTFDFTLRQPDNNQVIAWPLVSALYPNILREPVGLAFREWASRQGALQAQYQHAKVQVARLKGKLDDLLYFQLAASDVQGTVILGDPAAMLPLL